MYVSWIERDKILILQLSPPKFRCFARQNGLNGGLREVFWRNFDNFQKWILQTVRTQKTNETMWSFVSYPFFLHFFFFRFYLKIVKIHFQGFSPLGHSGLQTIWILELKTWDFVPFDSGNVNIKESKNIYFFFRVENQICLISWPMNILHCFCMFVQKHLS